jgi:subtilisin
VVNPTHYAYKEGLVVSAFGRRGTFPTGSYEESHVNSSPAGTDANDFIADFTNIGDVSFVAPGVGVISTVPGGYASRSGTSMACPIVSALAARILSTSPHLQAMPHDRTRVTSWITEINSTAKSRGFPLAFEGLGMPT